MGYRQVTSKSLTKAGVARTGTGKEVSEFYTAYDYPVIVTETKLHKTMQENKPFWSFLYSKKEESVTGSQGYVIELNDMHGKPKAKWSYSETSIKPISGTKFIYQDKMKNGVKCLENNVLQLEKDGDIITNEIGVDIEMVNDFRENKDESIAGGLQVNTEAMVLFIAPLVVPTILPSVEINRNEVYTAVTTKVINRAGVLKETRAFQEGAMISTQNHLYDAETGSLLLTSVQNEFKDRTYSFTQPAHWAYEGMGQAYKNIDLEFSNVGVTAHSIILPNGLKTEDYFVPGDKVLLTTGHGTKEICYVYKGDDGILNLINKHGEPFEYYSIPNCTVRVLKSGRKNLHNSPIGSVITKTNPLTGSPGSYSLQFQDILNTEAMEYSDQWQTFIPYIPEQICDTMTPVGKDYMHILNLVAQETDFFKHNYEIQTFMLGKLINGQTVYPSKLTKLISGNYVDWPTFIIGETDLYLDYGNGVYDLYEPLNPNSSHYNTHQLTTHVSYSYNSLPQSIKDYYSTSQLKVVQDTLRDSTNCPDNPSLSRQWSNPANTSISFMLDCCPMYLSLRDIDTIKSLDNFISAKRIDDYSATIFVEITSKNNVKDTIAYTMTSGKKGEDYCYRLYDCPPECYNVFYEKYINPYYAGLEGNWHPLRAFKYLDGRDYNPANEDPRNDGIYSNYSPFWVYNASLKKYEPSGTSNNKWVWTSKTTKYTPFGNELETVDALGRYSSALFGYHYTTPIAVASNSKVSQIAYDGFEDYSFLNQYAMYLCAVNHFNFSGNLSPTVQLDNAYRHTGRYSLKIDADNSTTISRQLTDVIQNTFVSDPDISRTLKPSDDVGIFRPEAGKYIVSAWVKEDRLASATKFDKAMVQVRFTYGSGAPTTADFKASGPIVEGWQRIEGELTVPATAEVLELKLIAADDAATWFDDVRVHPFDGNMASYAYDQRTMKLLGQLDENNYATIYEYDAEGTLIRVKKETEKGIQTLKETRNHYFKK